MSNFKPLVIGDLKIEKPVIQGGMGVGISLHRLAGAVAKAGGMGLISTAQIGFREPDFKTNFVEANLRAIRNEFKKAREIAPVSPRRGGTRGVWESPPEVERQREWFNLVSR